MLALHVKRWQFAILLYIIIILVIIAFRPALMFKKDLEMKQWGIVMDENTSIFSPAFVFPAVGLFSYFLAAILEMMFVA